MAASDDLWQPWLSDCLEVLDPKRVVAIHCNLVSLYPIAGRSKILWLQAYSGVCGFGRSITRAAAEMKAQRLEGLEAIQR